MRRESKAEGSSEPRSQGLKRGLRLFFSLLTVAIVSLIMVIYIVKWPGQGLVAAKSPPGSISVPSSDLFVPVVKTQGVREPAPNTADRASPPLSLRIATWNVRDCATWDAASGKRISLHDLIAGSIAEARADIVLLEEVQDDSKKGGDIALLAVALAKAGWSMPYVSVVPGGGQDDLAIFSRFRIASSGPVLKPETPALWPRPGIFAKVDIGAASLTIFGFHFKAMGDQKSLSEREAQALALANYLRASYGDDAITSTAIVVLGDFNTVSPQDFSFPHSTVSFLELKDDKDPGNDFSDLGDIAKNHGATYVGKGYQSETDHIFVSPALAAALASTKAAGAESLRLIDPPTTSDKIPASDHRLLLGTLLFR